MEEKKELFLLVLYLSFWKKKKTGRENKEPVHACLCCLFFAFSKIRIEKTKKKTKKQGRIKRNLFFFFTFLPFSKIIIIIIIMQLLFFLYRSLYLLCFISFTARARYRSRFPSKKNFIIIQSLLFFKNRFSLNKNWLRINRRNGIDVVCLTYPFPLYGGTEQERKNKIHLEFDNSIAFTKKKNKKIKRHVFFCRNVCVSVQCVCLCVCSVPYEVLFFHSSCSLPFTLKNVYRFVLAPNI